VHEKALASQEIYRVPVLETRLVEENFSNVDNHSSPEQDVVEGSEPKTPSPGALFPQCFFDDHDERSKSPSTPLSRLSDLYLQAADEKSLHTVLIWPGCLSSLLVIHGVACLSLWANGVTRVLRGLYYPAKRNSFYPLNRIFIDANTLCDVCGKRIYQASNGAAVTTPARIMSDKAVLFYALRSIKKEYRQEILRPSINELFPHFTKETKEDSFESYADHFYSRLKPKLDAKEKRALSERTCRVLGDPNKAPDGVFGLGYRLERNEMRDAVKELMKLVTPDVMLLDGTWNAVKNIPDWRTRFVDLIHEITKAFGERSPGILMVTDEPRQMSLFNAYLANAGFWSSMKMQVSRHGIVCPDVSTGFSQPEQELAPSCHESRIRLFVTDTEVGNLIDALYEVVKHLAARKADATSVRNAIGFLAKLSHLPGSVDGLWDYLNSRSIDEAVRNKFDWQNYRNALEEFIRQNGTSEEITALQQLIKQADLLTAAYMKGTPLGLRVLNEMQKNITDGKKTVVVVRQQLHRAVLSKYVEANSAGATDSIILSDEIEETLVSRAIDAIIFADMNPDILRTIFSNPRLPNDVVLILTVPMAKELKYTLTPLLQMQDFSEFHQQLKHIVDQLDQGLSQVGRSLIDNDFSQPTFSFYSYDDGRNLKLEEKDKVYIALEEGQSLQRGKHSQIYVYKPEAAGDTYGDFQEVAAENIEVGQKVFLMSEDLHDEVEAVLKTYNVGGSGRDAPYEEGLRQYHSCVSEQVTKTLGGSSASQLRVLKDRMLKINPQLEKELNNMKYWVNLEGSPETSFSDLLPHAPMHSSTFRAFCEALQIPETRAQAFWLVIQFIRGIRRGDGRVLSDVYYRILVGPESVAIYTNIPPEVINRLRGEAMEQVYTVKEIVC
jgi:hypothetical protein